MLVCSEWRLPLGAHVFTMDSSIRSISQPLPAIYQPGVQFRYSYFTPGQFASTSRWDNHHHLSLFGDVTREPLRKNWRTQEHVPQPIANWVNEYLCQNWSSHHKLLSPERHWSLGSSNHLQYCQVFSTAVKIKNAFFSPPPLKMFIHIHVYNWNSTPLVLNQSARRKTIFI